jgi:hypothetical protein
VTAKLLRYLCKLATDKHYRAAQKYRIPVVPEYQSADPKCYLTTATIIKDEGRYIREFVAFHSIVGVDHMLLYMDGGHDPLVAVALKDFLAKGFVTLIPWPRFALHRNNQFLAYQHAVALMRGRTRWLAMLDADEFLFAPTSGDLIAELRNREGHDALAVYSRTFGTGGVEQIEGDELVTERLTKRGAADHVKNRTQRAIVKPEAVLAIRSANSCVLRDTACLGWDEDGRPVFATGEAGHGGEHLRINHYFTRAEADFRMKLQRQYFGKGKRDIKMEGKLKEAADGSLSVEIDRNLHTYLPRLKRAVRR